MQQPLGFLNSNSTLLFKLNKKLYGLKQTQMIWYDKLHQTQVQFYLSSSKCGDSFFVYKHHSITLYVLVYVDDILLTDTFPNWFIMIIKLHNQLVLRYIVSKVTIFSWHKQSISNMYYPKSTWMMSIGLTLLRSTTTNWASMEPTQCKIHPCIGHQLEPYICHINSTLYCFLCK